MTIDIMIIIYDIDNYELLHVHNLSNDHRHARMNLLVVRDPYNIMIIVMIINVNLMINNT